MNLKKYQYSVSDTFLDFEFDSEGPKGKYSLKSMVSPKI